jgi:hypothetical protein
MILLMSRAFVSSLGEMAIKEFAAKPEPRSALF